MNLQYGGKLWVLDRATDKELRFKLAPMGGGVTGKYLQQWRTRKKFNQTEAAAYFGLAQSTIAKIESGDRKMPLEVFEKIRLENRKNYGRE
jgi:DNA-binding XRE family transcriptional regulator